MTKQKHLKQRIRARMKRTGERYVAARRHAVKERAEGETTAAGFRAFPGVHPASTALRTLWAEAGLVAPHTGEPPTEALAFGLAGGIGGGMFAFHYAKEDFQTVYLAGRHLWADDLAYVSGACGRVGLEPVVLESGGAKKAESDLRRALEEGPVMAWVEVALLPYRGVPDRMTGSGYHVLVVHAVDEARRIAWVGDLGDEPIELPLRDLAAARARIKKQKNRLLRVGKAERELDLEPVVRAGLEACVSTANQGRLEGFTLGGFAELAKRMEATRGKDAWATVFPPGRALFRGLRDLVLYIEHHGTGGGLLRPLFADFLGEAASALRWPDLEAVGERYRRLGEGWSELARTALPDEVPALARARTILAEREQAFLERGPDAETEVRESYRAMEAVEEQMRAEFPLSERESADLVRTLAGRVSTLHQQEVAALEALAAVVRG